MNQGRPVLDVGVVGLGTIAGTHLEVLASLEGVRVRFGVDTGEPSVTLPRDAPLLGSLEDALGAFPDVGLLVLATPTPTHAALASRALELTSALVLVEKPLSSTPAELAALEAAHGREVVEARLRVAHHFAFSPEVLRAEELVRAHPEWEMPSRIVSIFNDAYVTRPEAQLRSLVSSWIDSGGNQLSLLSRFASGFRVRGRAEVGGGFRSACRLEYDGGEALLTSNWLAGDTSKQTSLFFADGTELRMDHTSMTVSILQGVSLMAHVGNDGSVGRKLAHYDGLYRHLVSQREGRQASYSLARQIAEILAAPAGDDSVDWL